MIRVVAILFVLAAALTPSAAGSAEASMPIRLGKGIGPINLGMTGPQVYKVLGRPRTVVDRAVVRGQPYVELEYGLGTWTVGFYGRRGSRRVVLVLTALRRHRTPQGVGVGSTVRQVRRALPAARERRCTSPAFRFHWYLRHGNTETIFHPGTNREVTAVEVRSAPVLGCVT